jgi:hypothetical protein
MLTKIFTGQLATLDVPAIRALNPGVSLANKLFVSVRADQSAATLAVTSYFHETNPEVFALGGRNNEFASGPMDIFPAISGVLPVTGETKLLATLTNPDPDPISDASIGWIGYMSSAAAEFGALSSVTIVDSVGGGAVTPSTDSFTAAYEEATVAADGSYKFDYTPSNPLSYPLTMISSMVVPKLKFGDPKIQTFKSFISWVAIEGQDAKYLPLGYAPLPRALSASAIRISQTIGQAAIPKPKPKPTPTSSETSTETAPPDYGSGGTNTTPGSYDPGTTDNGGTPNTTTEKVRLSAFSETQVSASPIARLLIFVLLGLFVGSAISSLKPRK